MAENETPFSNPGDRSISEILDGKPGSRKGSPDFPAAGRPDPFQQQPPGVLVGPAPRSGVPASSYGVDLEALLPAAGNASALAGDIRRLADTIADGAPTGMPGFTVGFQCGEVNRGWAAKMGFVSEGLGALSTKILKTRWAYQDAEITNAAAYNNPLG